MSVRVNLLPEARIQKLKNQQTKRLVTIIAVLVNGGIILVLIILLLILGARNILYARNQGDIDKFKKDFAVEETNIKEINQFNQDLNEASRLSVERIYISKIFEVLPKILADGSSLKGITVDEKYNISTELNAKSYDSVAQFIVTLQDFNVKKEEVPGFGVRPIFLDIKGDSVTEKDGAAIYAVKFTLDKDLVKKFREDARKATVSPSPSPSPVGGGGN